MSNVLLFFPNLFPYLKCNTDVSDIMFVINYDYPHSSEDYVHRIGRTARSDKHGTAYTFFTAANSKQVPDLLKVLRQSKQNINPQLEAMANNFHGFGRDGKWGTCQI